MIKKAKKFPIKVLSTNPIIGMIIAIREVKILTKDARVFPIFEPMTSSTKIDK